jgi:hypothetical protein
MAENKSWVQKLWFPVLVAALLTSSSYFIYQGMNGGLSGEVRKMAKTCEALENKETCYGKAFANLTKETNMDYAFTILRKLQEIEPESRGCHFIAHSISIAETEKDPSKWREILNNAPQDCSYGAAHGALEVHAAESPDGKLAKSEIPTICDNPDTKNCTHGLGHLLLVVNENDIDASLKDCALLPHNDVGKFECLSGVFMERITAFNLETHGLATKEALNWPARLPELEALCRSYTSTSSEACWKEIAHVAVVKFQGNPQAVVDFCQTAPTKEADKRCIDHSLGILTSDYQFDLSKMKGICDVRAEASDFKGRCYNQLVGSTLATLPREIEAAEKFCTSLEPQYQESCLGIVRGVQARPRSGN